MMRIVLPSSRTTTESLRRNATTTIFNFGTGTFITTKSTTRNITTTTTAPSTAVHTLRQSQWHFRARPRCLISFPLRPHPRNHRSYSNQSAIPPHPPPPHPFPAPTLLQIKSIPAPHHGSIRIISLNRPRARNALSRQLVTELRLEVERARQEVLEYKQNRQHDPKQSNTGCEQQIYRYQQNNNSNNININSNNDTTTNTATNNSPRALIFSSTSTTCFCAGADLKERATFTAEQTRSFLAALRTLYNAITTLPIPTITAISSSAFGGGLELALATTFRVFAAGCVVALPETANLAIIPGAGGTFRLPGLVGLSRATEMVLTGRRVSGHEAARWGVCERVVDEEEEEDVKKREGGDRAAHDDRAVRLHVRVDAEAIAFARELCKGAPLATMAALKAVRGWQDGGASEAAAYEEVVGTRDRNEALAAFREKRAPVFEGR